MGGRMENAVAAWLFLQNPSAYMYPCITRSGIYAFTLRDPVTFTFDLLTSK